MQKRSLLLTLRNDPTLPSLLNTLPAAALARLVERVGLNDAGELMELTSARKLLQALDESVWKSPAPGRAEVFDAEELIDWLEAWNEIGDEFVADRLAAMSDDYRAMCLSHLVRVGIHHTLSFLAIPDDEMIQDPERETLQPLGTCALYGSYMVGPVIEGAWDIVHASLDAMWSHCPEELLRTLTRLDGAESMLAAQEGRRRLTMDVAHERERRRENLGYVSGTGASAFLMFIAITSMEELAALSAYDEETRRHLAAFGRDDDEVATPDDDDEPVEAAPELDRLRTVLEQEQVLIPQDALLLTDQSTREQPAITALLAELVETDPPAFERCARELAYLANVLKLGARVKGAAMSDIEARDAAYAACDRGLAWVRDRGLEPCISQEPGLIRLFALGWKSTRSAGRHRRA
jgi:hypothetical protein